MKFYILLSLMAGMVFHSTANDLNFIVKNTSKGSNTGAIDLSISTGVPPYQVKWTGPNGFNAATEDLFNLAAGTYSVTVTDAYCGMATTSVSITDDLTSVEEVNGEQIRIFPNPATAEVNIQLPEVFKDYRFRLVNAMGEVLMEKHLLNSYLTVDMEELGSGMYLMEFILDDRVYRKKVMKYKA